MQPAHPLDQTIELPAGFTARPGNFDDLQACFEMFNADSLHTTGAVDCNDPNLILNDWKDPKFSMDKSTRLVFDPAGKLAAYIEVWDTNKPPVHPWIWCSVHPDYHSSGIANALYAWAEARAAQAEDRIPAGVRFAPRTGFPLQYAWKRSLVEARGWVYTRSYYRMETVFDGAPDVPPAPQGIVIRPYNPETELEAVVQTFIDSFRDHYGFVVRPLEVELENYRHHFLGDPIYDPSLWYVAMDGEQMAGICICRAEDYEKPDFGFVNELGVRREWRKRGIGGILLKTAFAEFHRRGQKGAALGVDAFSLTGALRIYERAGMHAARQYDNFEKELRAGEELSTQTL
jgi:GNAT superfamily N-acetyltransferase